MRVTGEKRELLFKKASREPPGARGFSEGSDSEKINRQKRIQKTADNRVIGVW